MKKGMFYKAEPLIFLNARELRNNLTPAEQIFLATVKRTIP
jgi:hypothetical protein